METRIYRADFRRNKVYVAIDPRTINTQIAAIIANGVTYIGLNDFLNIYLGRNIIYKCNCSGDSENVESIEIVFHPFIEEINIHLLKDIGLLLPLHKLTHISVKENDDLLILNYKLASLL